MFEERGTDELLAMASKIRYDLKRPMELSEGADLFYLISWGTGLLLLVLTVMAVVGNGGVRGVAIAFLPFLVVNLGLAIMQTAARVSTARKDRRRLAAIDEELRRRSFSS